MLEHRRTVHRATAALATLLAVTAVSSADAAAAQKLKAHPKKVMVDTDTTLKGSGFQANTTVTLEECSATFWIFPSFPCNTANEQTVKTDAKGRFTASFKVELCPEEAPPAGGATKRTCYIGVPKAVEDTGMLEPAARVIVSYP